MAAVKAAGRSSARFTLQLLSSLTNLRVTQAGFEAWVVNTPNFRTSQVGFEVWRTTATAVTVEAKVRVGSQSKGAITGIAGVIFSVRISAQGKASLRLQPGNILPWLFTVT